MLCPLRDEMGLRDQCPLAIKVTNAQRLIRRIFLIWSATAATFSEFFLGEIDSGPSIGNPSAAPPIVRSAYSDS